jgi:hypothetical protein
VPDSEPAQVSEVATIGTQTYTAEQPKLGRHIEPAPPIVPVELSPRLTARVTPHGTPGYRTGSTRLRRDVLAETVADYVDSSHHRRLESGL